MSRLQHPALPASTDAGCLWDAHPGFLTTYLNLPERLKRGFLDLELPPHPLSLLFLLPKVALFGMQLYFWFFIFFSLGKIWLGLYCFSTVPDSRADTTVTAQLYGHGWFARLSCDLITIRGPAL